MLFGITTFGYNETHLVENDAPPSVTINDEDEAVEVELEGKDSNLASVEYSRSMASEATHNVAHLSPKKRLESYPEEIASPSSGVLSTISDQSETIQSSSLSKPYTSRVSRILDQHRRVPGGAAAKLIGCNQEEECNFVNEGDDAIEVRAPVEELMRSREQVVAEFSVGSAQNKRYHAPEREERDDSIPVKSQESRSRIIDRNQAFHDNATAAILSILTPANNYKNAPEIADILTAKSTDIHSPGSSGMKGLNASPFLRPATKSSEAIDDAFETINSTGRNPLVQNLLTKKTERHLAAIKSRMKDPSKNLTDLIESIVSPPKGQFNRHYMVRRKNACGALKIMAGSASHRVNLCWTVGVLPALASVLEDSGPGPLKEKFPIAIIRREFVEARKRALLALVYLAQPKDNRLPIFHCPRLVASLVRVIEQDDGEARQHACSVLAQLSKGKENRLIMAQVPGLIDAVTLVIKPKKYIPRLIDDDESAFSDNTDEEASEHDLFEQLSDDLIEMTLSEKCPRRALPEEPIVPDIGELSARYDEDPDPFLSGTRKGIFALLNHLTKEKDNEFLLARNSDLVNTLVAVTKLQESTFQKFALKVLANLSRHRSNSKILVFKMKEVVPAVVYAMDSGFSESTKFACYCLQNFSQDKPCRQQLASIENLLASVCRSIRDTTDPEQKLSALHTLKNLADEPANLIPMSNTPDCYATLIQVAHASDESISEMMQYIACDALATQSHWFRSIATSGQRIGMVDDPDSFAPRDELFVPSQRIRTWEAWQ